MISPLTSTPLFHIGPAPVTEAVVVTWAIMAIRKRLVMAVLLAWA